LSFAFVASPALAVPTIDTTTKGNWVGVYGSSGYILPHYAIKVDNTNTSPKTLVGDVASLPSFISSYSYSGANGFVWDGVTTDIRAPQDPANPGGNRTAATAYDGDYTITLNVSQAAQFQLGIYGLDWDTTARDIAVTVNSETVDYDNVGTPDYNQGMWGIWTIDALGPGPLVISVDHQGGVNSVLSAITFDEIVEIPEPASIAMWLFVGACGAAFAWFRRR
jgi:hypothetical protein